MRKKKVLCFTGKKRGMNVTECKEIDEITACSFDRSIPVFLLCVAKERGCDPLKYLLCILARTALLSEAVCFVSAMLLGDLSDLYQESGA